MKKKKERSKLRKLLGLMIVLPAADMGSAFCFTCSTLIVTSLHSCCHRNQEQRQNKTAVKSWAQTREADPYTLFKSYFVNGRSILRQKQQEGRGEGRVEIKAHLDRRGILWVVTSWVGLKVKMARYFLRSSLKTQRAHGTGCVCTYFFFFYFF